MVNDQQLMNTVSGFQPKPQAKPTSTLKLPSQSELPTEFQKKFQVKVEEVPSLRYYFFPTDLYLPEWFSNVEGARPSSWNETELRRMHRAAAQGFAATELRAMAVQGGEGPGAKGRVVGWWLVGEGWVNGW